VDEQAIIAAVDCLNAQAATLPDDVPFSHEGVYPEFDYEPFSPSMYLLLIEEEMRDVEAKIRHEADPDRRRHLERLCTMLLQCAIALRETGVE